MQDNLFSSIFEHEKIVSKYRAAPPVLKPTNDVINSVNTLSISESNNRGIDDHDQQSRDMNFQKSSVALPRYKICIDGVDKIAEASMLKSAYIVYRIKFTRASDLQSHATWKRFKEISSWFQEVTIYDYPRFLGANQNVSNVSPLANTAAAETAQFDCWYCQVSQFRGLVDRRELQRSCKRICSETKIGAGGTLTWLSYHEQGMCSTW